MIKGISVLYFLMIASSMVLTSCFNQQTGEEAKNTDSIKATKIAQDAAILPENPEETLPWQFEVTGKGSYDEPLTKVSIIIGNTTYIVAKDIMGNCNVLEPAQWVDYRIPASAESACMSWWAGAGDVFYIQINKGMKQVFHGEIGEGMDFEKDLVYKKVLEVSATQQ